jgi:hypothetical protein
MKSDEGGSVDDLRVELCFIHPTLKQIIKKKIPSKITI